MSFRVCFFGVPEFPVAQFLKRDEVKMGKQNTGIDNLKN